jgi:RNA polymerase sigma-70 factor, ECF subfamily
MRNSNLAQIQKPLNSTAHSQAYEQLNTQNSKSVGDKEAAGKHDEHGFIKAPDELLAELYVSKNAEWAFNELVNRYSCKIYNLAYKYTKDESNANDVLQEVFLALFQKLDTFRGESKFSTWVYGITRNTSLMYLKKYKKHLNTLSLTRESSTEDDASSDFVVEDWRFIPDTIMMQEEKRYKVDEAMSTISEIFSTVLRLRDLEGRTNVEIGKILGISLPAVKSRVRRARTQLRESLAQHDSEELY